MPSSNFIDHVQIYCRSGKGGAGSVHFYRDKLTAKGGPDGGDGGRGGHIVILGNKQLWTLLHLRYRKHVHASPGEPGAGNMKTGKQGTDVILEVPPGTEIRDKESGKMLFEIMEHGEKRIILYGGQGGQGNAHFKSSVRQMPVHAQPGGPAVEGAFIFELKLLADVGMVGFPNAGKSTMLSVLSAATPRIADYAFTTLQPQLGVVDAGQNRSFVLADLPGIIERSHEGKGLGYRFLRHIERSAMLLFVISAENLDVQSQYDVLLKELENYRKPLAGRPKMLAVTKTDLIDSELRDELTKNLPGIPYVFVSSFDKSGLIELKSKLYESLVKIRDRFNDE